MIALARWSAPACSAVRRSHCKAVEQPGVADDVVDQAALDFGLRLAILVEAFGERGESGGILAGADGRLGVDSGFQSVHAGGGLPLLGAWAGRVLRVTAEAEAPRFNPVFKGVGLSGSTSVPVTCHPLSDEFPTPADECFRFRSIGSRSSRSNCRRRARIAGRPTCRRAPGSRR